MHLLLALIISIIAFFHPAPHFGGTTVVQKTPAHITSGIPYDTPSGGIDVGYYIDTPDGPMAHLPSGLTASGTRQDGFYPGAIGKLAQHIGITVYTFYDENENIIGTSTDPTIATKLFTKDAPLPTISVIQSTP